MESKYKILGIVEYILGIVAAVGLFLFVHLNMSIELQDPDIWLHIKTGEYIVQHQEVPRVDIFSSTISGKEWIDHSWLVQVIFYLVFHFGGADNLIFLSSIIVTLAFLFLFLSVYRQRRHLTLCVAMLFLTILASRIRMNIRPENFSILFFSVYLFILTRQADKKWIFLLPLIQLIWVNAHGFFILGPLMVGIFIFAEKLKRANLLPWEWGKADALDNKSYKNLWRVFVFICLVSFINPYGYKGALYPLWVSFNSLLKSGIYYKYIEELLPTWRHYQTIGTYYILIAISSVTFLLNFKRINLAHLMLWLIFLGISFKVNRNIIFFNFFAFLAATEGLFKLLDTNKFDFIEGFLGKSRYLFMYLLRFIGITVLILWVIKSANSIMTRSYYIFDENRTKSILLGITAKKYPDKPADFILKNGLPANIFNQFNYGSYLIYRLFPKQKVFIDGRTELYGDDFFKDYQKILAVDKGAIDDIFDKYNINTVLLREIGDDFGTLASYFFNSRVWALVYFDENSLIFLKDSPQNKLLVSRLKVDLKKWRTQKADLDKIGMKNVYPEPYINRGWIFYYLGLDEQALNETKETLRILPSCSDAYNIIGRIYLKQKLYSEASEALRLARIYGPSYDETLISLGDLYTQTGKFDAAVKVFKKLSRLNPYSGKGFYLLGRSYNRIKNTKSALKSLRNAIKLDPFSAAYYKELGELLYENNDLKGAGRVYEGAIDMGLDITEFRNRLNAVQAKMK